MDNEEFRFRTLDSIGAAGAEEDELLSSCFVDISELSCLEDINDRRVILLGRTGAGKTALLKTLATKRPRETISIAPEELALTYVSNSNILSFFASIGVNLDPFFKLLWRHVIVVEILARHVSSLPVERPNSLLEWLRPLFSSSSREDKEMRKAIDYLEEWGKTFWLETEFRVKEITEKLETELKSSIQGRAGLPPLDTLMSAGISGKMDTGETFTEEQKAEIKQRGQQVVSKAQVQDLQKVMTLLGEVLAKSGYQYYLLIDRLDENWVEEQVRYRLIMALLDTAKEFIKIERAKVVVALRRDLLERVFRITREAGFQEEKYESLCIPIIWSKKGLISVLDKRVDYLVRHRYTKKAVTHRDLLPETVRKTDITDYFWNRTERPRDIIAFFNACIQAAPNLSKLTPKEIAIAENEYSRGRLRALGDEWSADYPELLDLCRLLSKRRQGFKIEEIKAEAIEEKCLELLISGIAGAGLLGYNAKAVVECITDAQEFRILLFKVFYSVGLVGLQVEQEDAVSWADERGRGMSLAAIRDTTRVYIHPMYHRVLGIEI